VYTTRDYGITYLFHDRRARVNTGLYEQRDQLVTLGHASVEWVMGRYFTPDTVLSRAPSRIFFQLRLAEQYFPLIFGSAGFTRTGENVAELRLVAQFAAKIRLKQ